jgi:hypothetical protein
MLSGIGRHREKKSQERAANRASVHRATINGPAGRGLEKNDTDETPATVAAGVCVFGE